MILTSACRLFRVLLALFAAHAAVFAQGRSELALSQLAEVPHVPNEVIVQYRAGVTQSQKSVALARISGTRHSNVVNAAWRRDGLGDLDLVRLPPGLSVAAGVRGLEADPAVAFVEPNWVYKHTAVSNDSYFTNGSLWGMYGANTTPANPFGSGAAAAWAAGKTGSANVYVGIIDEGVFFGHADLAANAGVNTGEASGLAGKDDDGNGYVDDVNGWDFDGNNNTVYDGTVDDHGTHVAGTIAGVGGNGAGVAGVCWNVKFIVAKFLGANGGTTANAIKAVDYMTDLKTRRGINLVATNNSWGGGGFSQGLQDAIERANVANILFVAAAGNSGKNIDRLASYPACYPNANIISVAAIDSAGAVASFSNYGAKAVDIGAPGVGIWSTVPGSGDTSTYASYSGTSMATPHVTGACALYASLYPGSTAAQIKAAILNSAIPTASLYRKTVTGGRLNVSGF
ncbi:MAG: S8 family peptidase [Opitutaceae bacterium]